MASPPLSRLPLLWPATVFAGAILIYEAGITTIWLAAAVTAAIIVAIILRRHTAALLGVIGLCGWLTASVHRPVDAPPAIYGHLITFTANVREACAPDSRGWQRLIVTVDSAGSVRCARFRAAIDIPAATDAFYGGEKIRFEAELTPTVSSTDLPDEFDANAFLRANGVVAKAIVSQSDISVTGEGSAVVSLLRRTRSDITDAIFATRLSDATKYFLNAVITGDDSTLSADSRSIFSRSGLAHILALSGLHVAILTTIIFAMLLPLYLSGRRRAMRIITIILLWLFAAVTGMSASVTRAVVMTTIVLGGRILGRRTSAVNSLLAAAILILLFDPGALLTIGFQFSFLAVLAILLLSPVLNPVGPTRNRLLRIAGGYVAACVAAVAGTGIIASFYFHTFPVYFLIANAVTSLILPFLIAGGIAVSVLGVADINFAPLDSTVDFLYNIIVQTANAVIALPGSTIDNIYISPLTTGIYVAALIAACAAALYRNRTAVTVAAVALAGVFVSIALTPSPDRDGVEMYIVRNHYATDILLREGRSFRLVTTARNPGDEARRLSALYSDYMGRRGIDSLAIAPAEWSGPYSSRQGRRLSFLGRTFYLLDRTNAVADSCRPDYLVICKGFRGDVLKAACRTGCDSVLLSSDLNLKRHDRYLSELRQAGIPTRSLRDQAYFDSKAPLTSSSR